MDREVAQKVEKALKEATQLKKVGQEPAGRDRIQQALAKAEVELKQIETRQPAQLTQSTQIGSRYNRTTPKRNGKRSQSRSSKRTKSTTSSRKSTRTSSTNPKMDREVAQKVEQALKEATSYNK